MSIVQEFKKFAMRGNVIDLAVGVIIGGAFGKITSSVVADIIMPPIGLLVGGINFTDMKIKMKDAVLDSSGKILSEAVTLNIGNFFQVVFDFTIVAVAIFVFIKAINKFSAKPEPAPAAPPAPSKEVALLTEIRDLLKK